MCRRLSFPRAELQSSNSALRCLANTFLSITRFPGLIAGHGEYWNLSANRIERFSTECLMIRINPAPSCRGIAPRRKAILSHSSPQQAAGYSGRCWINSEWGAISKTNHEVLRYREPVYKSVRDLVMSYFHEYFLNDGKKTLRSSTEPVDLSRFYSKNWITSDTDLWYIDEYLNRVPHTSILNKKQVAYLRRADKIEIRAGKLTTFKRGSK